MCNGIATKRQNNKPSRIANPCRRCWRWRARNRIEFERNTANSKRISKKCRKKISNWKAPGIDKIQNFWIKHITVLNVPIVKGLNDIMKYPSIVPEWITEDKTTLIPKIQFSNCISRPYTFRWNIITFKFIIDVRIWENIFYIFDVNSVSSTYSLYKITNGDDQKVTKNTIYSEICIICPQIGKWSILYIIQKYYKKYQNIFAKTRVLFKTFVG